LHFKYNFFTNDEQMLVTNENHQKTAQETVKYEVHGGGAPEAPPRLNHQRYEKPKISRGLTNSTNWTSFSEYFDHGMFLMLVFQTTFTSC